MATGLITTTESVCIAAAGPKDLLQIIPQLVLSLLVTFLRAKAQSNQECACVGGGIRGGHSWTSLSHKSLPLHLRAAERDYVVSLLQ